MREVNVRVTFDLRIVVNDGVELDDVIGDLSVDNYSDDATISYVEVVDYEVKDSR